MMSGRNAIRLLTACALLLLPLALQLLHANKFQLPTAQWDGTALDAVLAMRGGTFSSDPYLIHPPLYLHLLNLFQPLFQADLLAGARLFNAACYLLTGWVVFLLSASLSDAESKTGSGLAGALLYLISPLAVQGVFLLDLGDTSLIPLAAGAYFLCAGGPGNVKLACASVLFGVNLWSKLIHSLFIGAAAFTEWAWSRGTERRNLAAVLCGGALFLCTWAIYAFVNLGPDSRWRPITYFFGEMIFGYQARSLAAGPADAAFDRLNSAVRIAAWIWPLLLAWLARLYNRGMGRGRERFFNLFLIIFLTVSVLSKGTSNGFPKYHAVALPLLCSLGGSYLYGLLAQVRLARLPAGLLLSGLAVWAILVLAGDPLYVLNYSVRAALISANGLSKQLLILSLHGALAIGSGAALFLAASRILERRAAAALAVLGLALVWSAAVGFRQARADYFTTYGYGTRGKAQTVSWLADHKGQKVLGPNEFEWELRAAGVPFIRISDLCTGDRACVLNLLRDPGTGFFVFGQASNTVEQVKNFLAMSEADLGRSFSAIKIGDFWIYSLGRRP